MSKEKKETIELFLIMIIVILLITTFFFVIKSYELTYYNKDAYVNNIINKKWYSMSEDLYYETFSIDQNKDINYYYKDNLGNDGVFNGCSKMLYSSRNNYFKVKCEEGIRNIKIETLTNETLVLLLENGKKVVYTSKLGE